MKSNTKYTFNFSVDIKRLVVEGEVEEVGQNTESWIILSFEVLGFLEHYCGARTGSHPYIGWSPLPLTLHQAHPRCCCYVETLHR